MSLVDSSLANSKEDDKQQTGSAQPVIQDQVAFEDPNRYRMLDPYSEEGKKQLRKKRLPSVIAGSVLGCIVVVLIAVFAVINLSGPHIEDYADQPISIVGLKSETFTVTPAELIELDCISENFTGQGQAIAGQENIKKVTAYGPLLSDFVAANGASLDQFSRAIAMCSDGYNVILTPEMLSNDIVMSVAQGSEPLDENHQPMRLVIPSEESGKWAFGVTTIIFESKSDDV